MTPGSKRLPQERPMDAEGQYPVFFVKRGDGDVNFALWRCAGVPLTRSEGPHFVGFFGEELVYGHISRGEPGRMILLVKCTDGKSDFSRRFGRANVVVNRFARVRLFVNLIGQSASLWASISKGLSVEDLYLCGLKPGQLEKRQAEQTQGKSKESTSKVDKD